MRFVFLTLVIILALLVCHSKADKESKLCFAAKTCVHSGRERCGYDQNQGYRRFYDTCDILEYNCLYGTAFTKASNTQCQNLPPIENTNNNN